MARKFFANDKNDSNSLDKEEQMTKKNWLLMISGVFSRPHNDCVRGFFEHFNLYENIYV